MPDPNPSLIFTFIPSSSTNIKIDTKPLNITYPNSTITLEAGLHLLQIVSDNNVTIASFLECLPHKKYSINRTLSGDYYIKVIDPSSRLMTFSIPFEPDAEWAELTCYLDIDYLSNVTGIGTSSYGTQIFKSDSSGAELEQNLIYPPVLTKQDFLRQLQISFLLSTAFNSEKSYNYWSGLLAGVPESPYFERNRAFVLNFLDLLTIQVKVGNSNHKQILQNLVAPLSTVFQPPELNYKNTCCGILKLDGVTADKWVQIRTLISTD
ncbi:hypothetical protein G9P44_003862 [Scheffersomyces stipitis]|nr:hypothetical protein G9P44_003862 [Scheffersomyces stipitis]